MSSPAVLDHQPPSGQAADRFRVGTLRYTAAGLAWLFFWLLWGDSCYVMMEQITANIVPLRLKEQLNAPDWTVPIILTTIPSIINFVLNPLISTKSDRHRGRWGRRIPFLLFSAPFLAGALVLLAFSPQIGTWVHRLVGPSTGWTLAGVGIFTLGFLLATFKIFDMFLNTTFWYLFNDVVPQAFMNRFMGLFRVVACGAAMLYSWFLFEHSLTHLRAIFLGAAAIYLFGFGAMCLFVKEGQYPPPDPIAKKEGNVLGGIWEAGRTYVRECLSHRLYWYFFLMGMFGSMANAIMVFQLYLNLSLGVTKAQLGHLNTVVQFVMLVLNYPLGALADRHHPIRILLYMQMGLLIIAPLSFVWLLGNFTPTRAFHVMITLQAIELPIGMLAGAVGIPLMMRLLPKDRFGQFCSFNALCGATINILASMIAAAFMTAMRWMLPDARWGKDFCYRMIPAWRIPLLCVSMLFLLLLYREWKRLGGEKSYVSPGFSAAGWNATVAPDASEVDQKAGGERLLPAIRPSPPG